MPIAGIVADANVLLSAVVGKAALRVFTRFEVVVHVTQFNADKVPNIFRTWRVNMSCRSNSWRCSGNSCRFVVTHSKSTVAACHKRLLISMIATLRTPTSWLWLGC